MALPTVIAKNQTVTEIYLPRLGQTVPPTPGQIVLSDFASFYEIASDPLLHSSVTGGTIVLNDGTSDLNAGEGIAYIDATGNFCGPTGTITGNTLVRLDGTTGRYSKTTGITVDDSNNINTPGNLTAGTVTITSPGTGPTDGVSRASHETLRQLIHFIDSGPAEGFASGAFCEVLPTGSPFPTSEIWWTSAAKTSKIVSTDTTYNTNKTIATETWKMYDTDGTTLLATVLDTYAYSTVFISNITRTIS